MPGEFNGYRFIILGRFKTGTPNVKAVIRRRGGALVTDVRTATHCVCARSVGTSTDKKLVTQYIAARMNPDIKWFDEEEFYQAAGEVRLRKLAASAQRELPANTWKPGQPMVGPGHANHEGGPTHTTTAQGTGDDENQDAEAGVPEAAPALPGVEGWPLFDAQLQEVILRHGNFRGTYKSGNGRNGHIYRWYGDNDHIYRRWNLDGADAPPGAFEVAMEPLSLEELVDDPDNATEDELYRALRLEREDNVFNTGPDHLPPRCLVRFVQRHSRHCPFLQDNSYTEVPRDTAGESLKPRKEAAARALLEQFDCDTWRFFVTELRPERQQKLKRQRESNFDHTSFGGVFCVHREVRDKVVYIMTWGNEQKCWPLDLFHHYAWGRARDAARAAAAEAQPENE
eukprot:GFYU01014739.1.p1 GENE.GFYU01014739.1~~GFYU01014739.1.p1  ORF type:complete len:398 (+),score=40.11 GFYU01014739.1:42-1235(+)